MGFQNVSSCLGYIDILPEKLIVMLVIPTEDTKKEVFCIISPLIKINVKKRPKIFISERL